MAAKKSSIINVIKYSLFLGIGISLLYLAFRNTDLNQLIEDLKGANYYWVSLSMFFGVAAYISRGIRWLILLEPMGYKPKVSNSIYAVILGYFANLAVPRIGEVARCTALNQVEKIPVDKLFGTVILERVIDFAMLLAITFIAILSNIELFGNFFLDLFSSKADSSEGLSTLSIIAISAVVVLTTAVFLFRKRLSQLSFMGKIKDFIKGIKDGFIVIGKLKKKRWFIFHTLLIWSFYYFMAYVCFFSIDATSGLSYTDGLFVLAAGGFGMAAPVQGGIGVYHYVVSLSLGVLAIEQSDGLLFATIVHTSQTLLTLVVGAISVLLLYLARRSNVNVEKPLEA